MAGQTQGWGGIDIGLFECLTRTGPLFMVDAEDLEPLPNLAKSWDWSEDGKELTIHLIEGAKWSDGDPFDADDMMFYWDDHVIDPELTPLNGASPETFGDGTTLDEGRRLHGEVHLHPAPFPRPGALRARLRHLLPGAEPRHEAAAPEVLGQHLRPVHQRLPADLHELPGDGRLGAGRVPPGRHRRHAPQPLLLEGRRGRATSSPTSTSCNYRLSTWADRDVQAVAGTGDFSNLEQPENFVESLTPRRRGQRAGAARVRAADHRLLDVPELLGQRLGRARRARPGGARAQPQPRLPQGGQPGDRPAAAGQRRW